MTIKRPIRSCIRIIQTIQPGSYAESAAGTAEGSQSYGITRSITLSVQPNAADFNSLTTANSSLAGTYFETTTLTGLGGATRTFTSAGNFTLTCISPIATLTTQ